MVPPDFGKPPYRRRWSLMSLSRSLSCSDASATSRLQVEQSCFEVENIGHIGDILGILDKKRETTNLGLGFKVGVILGIMEEKMELVSRV